MLYPIIYGLEDPRTGSIRYVGKSVRPTKRLQSHLNDRSGTKKSRWIQKLISLGLLPKVVILEKSSEDGWKEREKWWISFFHNSGNSLMNQTDGGEGVHNPDAESRRKLSKSRKQLFQNDEYRQWFKKKVANNPSRVNKISKALKGKKKSPEHIAKLPQNQKGFKHSEEFKEKIRRNNKGHRWTSEEVKVFQYKMAPYRFKIGNKSRTGQKQSKEERLKKSLATKGIPKTEEHKERIRQGQLESWRRRRNEK